MRSKTLAFALVTLAGAGALIGGGAMLVATTADRLGAPAGVASPAWTEVAWPFPMDQWGRGKAFHCKAADCGSEVALYLRAKIGFCNCTTGVADDEELDRVNDVELIGAQFAPLGPGREIAVGTMKGRSRAYAVGGPSAAKSALAVAFNDRCDVIVATVAAAPERAGAIEPAALEFLNGDTVMRWAALTLGL